MNIYDTLSDSVKLFSHKTAVTGPDGSYTYSELFNYSKKIASHLSRLKTVSGKKAVIYIQNSADFVASLYGANMAGMVFMPVSPEAKDLKIQEILQHSEAGILITTGSLMEVINSMDISRIPSLKNIVLLGDSFDETRAQIKCNITRISRDSSKADDFILYNWEENQPAAIFYLANTHGKPKGIMLSSKNILSNVEAIVEYLKMSNSDNILIVKSMSLVGTVTGEIIASVAVGAAMVVIGGIIHAGVILKVIEDFKVTGFFAVPVMLHQIIEYKRKDKYSIESLRYIQTGAARLSMEDVEQLMDMYKGVELYYIYGISEASPRVLHLRPEEMLLKAGSVGRPVKFVSVSLLDANGNIPGIGEIGELYVKGPNVMLGYYKDPELNNKVLTPYGLRTGDLAYMDHEGYVYLAGRADNMINQGGFHVYPAEIEKVISKLEKVKEVKVEGVPDDVLGQRIKAKVTPHENADLSADEIYSFCYEHMENSKIPKIIEILN